MKKGMEKTEEAKNLSKKERGRLKKLKGRASSALDNNSPGITNFEDALELRMLLEKVNYNSKIGAEDGNSHLTFGPSVHHVQDDSFNFQDPYSWKQTEGGDHRQLIQSILFGSNPDDANTPIKTKKRTRNENAVDIPSWCRLHNGALSENISVIEFSISSTDGNDCKSFMPSDRMQSNNDHNSDGIAKDQPLDNQHDAHEYILKKLVSEKRALPMRCKLFQGDEPRHITDVLMYHGPKPKSNKKIKSVPEATKITDFETDQALYEDTIKRLKPFILSSNQMKKENYPLKCNLKPDHGYVFSRQKKNKVEEGSAKEQNVYSIDCEMVRTTEKFELARVTLLKFCPTLIDPEQYQVVYDELVKPSNQIKDYVTKYSGITPSMMEGVTTSLQEVQPKLLSILGEDDILIGQSLENDLNVCQLVHMNVIDTAVLFRSEGGRKHSLKHLSAVLLHKKIQNDAVNGHCSEEDAAAALLLAIRRARLGNSFQIHEKKRKTNIFSTITLLRRKGEEEQPYYLRYNKGPLVCIGPSTWIQENDFASQCLVNALECKDISATTIKAIPSYLRPSGRKASVLWARLSIDGKLMDDKMANNKIDQLITSITSNASASSLVLLIFQRGYSAAKELFKQRATRKDERSTLGWTVEDEQKFKNKIEVARSCDVFWIQNSK